MFLSVRRLGGLALAVIPFLAGCDDDPTNPNDRTAPQVVSSSPASGATGVARNVTVSATFSEPIAPASANATTFTLKTSTGTVVPGTVSVSGATVTYTPSSLLAFNGAYTVAVTTGLTDLAGNAAQASTWSFQTVTNPAPIITGQSPAAGATNVDRGTAVTVTFDQAIAASSVTAASVSLTPVGGAAVPAALSVNGATITLTPNQPLAFGTTYTVRVTTGVTDTDGIPLAQEATWTFTTIANAAPSANAGSTQDVNRGETVQLSGSGADPEGEAVTYKWTQVTGPDVTGGVGFLTGQSPTFTAPAEVSSIRFELRTTDASGTTSQASVVQINVMEDKANAFFVSPLGNDANPGTRTSPVKTINRGVQLAAATGAGADVYVVNGLYDETVNLATGVSIYGGYASGSWLRSPGLFTVYIRGSSSLGMGVFGQNVSDVTLDGLDIGTPSEQTVLGQSLYAVFLVNAQNINVTRNSITAGNGQVGSGGQFGFNGVLGTAGGMGGNASCGATPTPGAGGTAGGPGTPSAGAQLGVAGGAGGSGGAPPNGSGEQGAAGASAVSASGGSGGVGGVGGPSPAVGQPGVAGTAGTAGQNGTGGASFGTFTTSGYVPADGSNGTNGTSGGGGGGGGGGGASNTGAGGGGGGGGGSGGGGNLGQGGKGGGGSFGLVALASTNVFLEWNSITSFNGGNGGTGGRGGNGGSGGPGRPGGVGCNGAMGGQGGNGGSGGNGGHGGGGGGGPSIAIVEGATSQLTISENNLVTSGQPGEGGFSEGNYGSAGIAATHKKLP